MRLSIQHVKQNAGSTPVRAVSSSVVCHPYETLETLIERTKLAPDDPANPGRIEWLEIFAWPDKKEECSYAVQKV